jgi:hypothetical protein
MNKPPNQLPIGVTIIEGKEIIGVRIISDGKEISDVTVLRDGKEISLDESIKETVDSTLESRRNETFDQKRKEQLERLNIVRNHFELPSVKHPKTD